VVSSNIEKLGSNSFIETESSIINNMGISFPAI